MPEKSMKRKTFTVFIGCIMIAAMLSGCGNKKKDQDLADMLEKTGEDASIEIEDPRNDKTGEPEKREDDTENDKDEKTDSAPVYCIGGPNDVDCETIHIIDESGSYKALSDQLEALNDNFLKAAYDTGTDDIVSNICVRRADDKVFSFVHEYRESMGEVDFVQMRGYSFLTDSGKKLELSDIVTDEDRFYELLSDELHKNVTEDMMIISGEYDISADDFDAPSVIKQCLDEKRYGWVLDPQGVTFWFERVNALLPKASATVLFSTDKEGKVFNDEFAGNVCDEWIMRIPESYSSETYFDCNDDGTIDEIYWYADSGYQGDVFVDSGLGAKFNGRYFGSEEICPADDMPWTHYSVYLMHKDKKTVLVAHYYEEADSVWSSFSLTNDLVKSVDNVYAYPEYENYSDAEIGWLVPVDMSAIRVYSDRGGDETIEYPDEILTVETDGRMKVSELSTKSRKSYPGPTDGSDKKGPKTGLSKAEAGEIADNLGGMVCAVECHDYDGDGADEAYAALGENDELGGYMLESVWFIASDGTATKMRDDFNGLSMYSKESGYYIEYTDEDTGFFTAECGGYGSGWLNFLFGVKDGKPYELDLSMKIEGFYQDRPGVFYTLTDNYDDGHAYLITELEYDSKTGQFKKGRVTDENWLDR